MAWASRSKTISLFSSPQPSKSSSQPSDPPAVPYLKVVSTNVSYKIQDLDFSNVAYINAILNPCSGHDLDIGKEMSVLCVNVATVSAQRWLLGVFSKALEYHLLHNNLLFVDRLNYTFISWYSKLKDTYKKNLSQRTTQTPKSWIWMTESYLAELIDLFSTWLIYAIEEGYSHGQLQTCIYFLDLSRPKLMISDGFDKNSKHDRKTNPCFYQADLDAFRHVLFVIVNEKPVEDLLKKPDEYKYSTFKKDVPSYLKSFHDTLSRFPPNPCINRILLKPSFIRPLEARIKYFYNVLNYFYERPQERTAFNNLGWSWLSVVKKDKGYVGQFYSRSIATTTYQGDFDVLRFFRNADQHMIQDLKLASQGFTQKEMLMEFELLLGFSKMIDEKVHAHATTYPFSTPMDKETFLKELGF